MGYVPVHLHKASCKMSLTWQPAWYFCSEDKSKCFFLYDLTWVNTHANIWHGHETTCCRTEKRTSRAPKVTHLTWPQSISSPRQQMTLASMIQFSFVLDQFSGWFSVCDHHTENSQTNIGHSNNASKLCQWFCFKEKLPCIAKMLAISIKPILLYSSLSPPSKELSFGSLTPLLPKLTYLAAFGRKSLKHAGTLITSWVPKWKTGVVHHMCEDGELPYAAESERSLKKCLAEQKCSSSPIGHYMIHNTHGFNQDDVPGIVHQD